MAKLDTTDKVWVGVIGGLIIYEVYTLVNNKKGDTLSESAWRSLPRRPLVPFSLGMLLGHFVWQNQDVYDKEVRREFEEGQVVKEEVTITSSATIPEASTEKKN